MSSASEKLADRILRLLTREKLLSETEARKLGPKLAGGGMRPEDWRLAIELSISQKKKP